MFLGREPARIDLLNHVDGVRLADAWPRHEATCYGGVSVPVLDIHSLIAPKEALLARPRPAGKRLQVQADLRSLGAEAARRAVAGVPDDG